MDKAKLKIAVKNAADIHEYEELVKIFLRPEQYEIESLPAGSYSGESGSSAKAERFALNRSRGGYDIVTEAGSDKNICKQEIYRKLADLTGIRPPWGILTGIRPTKLFGDIAYESGGEDAEAAAERKFKEYYLVSDEKTALTRRIYDLQRARFGEAPDDSLGVYIGIPFCPTRCLYCSFASNPLTGSDIEGYLGALEKEAYTSAEMVKRAGMFAESIYVGGGTPTSLTAEQLGKLLSQTRKLFITEKTLEATCEAGRPDTIDAAKLRVMAENDFSRISINPQSMKQETLDRIGRDHTPDDVRRAFALAKDSGKRTINTDIIAGLPGEHTEDLVRTLEEMIELGADNITVHSLAVKRTSRLKEEDPGFHYKRGGEVAEMLEQAAKILEDSGYAPYYLYRQKHMSGALENIGYALPGTEGLYNVRIMDEHQGILAMGAGSIGKAYDPASRKLERVPNVKDYKVYIDRIDEMIQRKDKMFSGGKNAY